jgi:hypothetical protein
LAGQGFSAEKLKGAFVGTKFTILASNNPNVQKLTINTIIDIISVI